jgi:hypothetical protein
LDLLIDINFPSFLWFYCCTGTKECTGLYFAKKVSFIAKYTDQAVGNGRIVKEQGEARGGNAQLSPLALGGAKALTGELEGVR